MQRRHQKVLEEAPSPALDPELRARMSEAAVAFARAIGYRSAGTAEFMLDGRDFWFLELNGRIQVEHPVTELVSGADLVAEQIRIAQGEPLTAEPRLVGHAVEVRLYAEDPKTFLPQTGRLERLRLPPGIRVDAGVEEGDEIGTSYDPLIAKLIAHGSTREDALDRLAAALAETEVGGVVTNLPVPALAGRAPGPAGRRDDDSVPDRASAAVGAAAPAGRPSVARRLPAQPARAAAGSAARPGRRRRAGRAGAELAQRADARHRDQGARRRGRPRAAAPAAGRARGDEDGDAGRLALRGDRPRRPRAGRRPGRRRHGSGRARGVALEQLLELHRLAHVARSP